MILAGTILTWLIQIYTVLLIVRMLMSWVPLLVRDFEPHGALAVVFEIVYRGWLSPSSGEGVLAIPRR